MLDGIVNVSGGGGYPPGGGGPPGGGWGPPPGAPPGGGGYGPPPGAPPGGYGPPGGPPPGSPPGGWGPPGGPPPGPGPGGPPPGAPPGGWGPPPGPGGPPPGPAGPPPGGYGPPGGPLPGGPGPGYNPPGAPPGGGLPPGYVPPGGPPPGGYGPPGGGAPGGGYGPPGGAPGGGFGGPPGGYPGAPPGGAPPGGYGPPGGAPPPGWGGPPAGAGGPPGGYPGAFGAPPPTMGGGAGWSPMEAMTFAWNALMKNFAGVSLPIAVAIFVSILPGQVLGFTYGLLASIVAEYVEPSFIGVLSYLVQATSALLGLFIGSYISGGIVSFSLKVARGQPVAFGEVFSGGKYFGRMLVGMIGMYIAAAIGFVLCIVPGYIVMLGLSMFTFLIVDQGLPGIDALKKSWEMTKGHKVNIFVFFLLGFLVILAGALACGIGILLVSYPMLVIGMAYIYLKLKGEEPRLSA